MSSKVHTGFGHGCKRINKSQLDCLEHNDLITYIYCCMSFLIAYNVPNMKRWDFTHRL